MQTLLIPPFHKKPVKYVNDCRENLLISCKLSNIFYWHQVSAGLNCVFAQDVVAINTEEKHCCVVGELNKRAILIPDVDSILENISDL